MTYATKTVQNPKTDGAKFYIRIEQIDAANELSAVFVLPSQGRICRWRCSSDSGTILPRIVSEDAGVSDVAGGLSELAVMPGTAAASFDNHALGVYDTGGKPRARIQSQGTGTGRLIVHELWIADGWRA